MERSILSSLEGMRRQDRSPAKEGVISPERPEIVGSASTAGSSPRRGTPEAAVDGSGARPPSWLSASVVSLVVANAVPLLGVLWLGWDLDQIMILFWAENGVIGFYSLLRLVLVSGPAAIVLGPFFAFHFGAFMAGHFLFIFALFVEEGTDFPAGSALTALGPLLAPLAPALAALFVSHGVSFVTNFLRNREFEGRSASEQMAEPYRRVVILHVTIIFGGWIILTLGTPLWALLLLVVLKTGTDLWAHRREHAGRTTSARAG